MYENSPLKVQRRLRADSSRTQIIVESKALNLMVVKIRFGRGAASFAASGKEQPDGAGWPQAC